MSKLTNEDGEEVEAFTPEEVETKVAEAREEAKTEAEEAKQTEIDALTEKQTTLEADLKTKEEALESAGDKDQNFAKLRQAKETAEAKLKENEDTINGVKSEIGEIKESLSSKGIQDEAMRLAGNDKEVADKIEFHYKNFSGEPKDAKERAERFNNAQILAGASSEGGPQLPGDIISSGGASSPTPKSGEKLSQGGIEVAKKMGITDKEMKDQNLI